VAAPHLELGEVGEKRSLDRHEQLQRRARDQQDVEDDPGEDLVVRDELDRDDGGVQQRLLGEHDAGDRDHEAGRVARGAGDGFGGWRGCLALVQAERERQDNQRDERGGRNAERDGHLAVRDTEGGCCGEGAA
jgi:hypothetical protein